MSLIMSCVLNFSSALFCLFLSFVASHDTQNVIQYDTSAFSQGITTGPHFVMFFAPWCGHCKRLSPTWDELGKMYNVDKQRQDVTIAKIDCTEQTPLCSEQGVTGYPTLKFFSSKDNSVKYKGNRDLAHLIKFVEEQLTLPPTEGAPSSSDSPSTQNGLIDWSETTFSKFTERGHHFVKFFAPWCGHCKKLAPTWEQLAKELEADTTVTIGRVDCTVHSKLCQSHNVRGYPTLLWFSNGNMINQYDGPRELESLKQYVTKMKANADPSANQPDAERVPENGDTVQNNEQVVDVVVEEPTIQEGLVELNEKTFQSFMSHGSRFIKFFAPWCGHCQRLAPTWAELAKSFQNDDSVAIVKIDCSQNIAPCQQHNVRGYPTLAWFSNGKLVDKYQGSRELEDLKAYVSRMNTPQEPVDAVLELTDETFPTVTASGDYFIKFFAPWCTHCKHLAPNWAKLGIEFALDNAVKIAKVDCSVYQSLCQSVGVTGFPTLMYYRDGAKVKDYNGNRALDDLKNFVNEQKLTRSSPPPPVEIKNVEEQVVPEPYNILALTLDTFSHMTASGSSFVEYYAPWCSHCKLLEPTWQELARRFSATKNLRVVKVDCTVEVKLCQDQQIKNFPTLRLYREGALLSEYSGSRDIDSLSQFVTANVPVSRDEL